MRIPNHKHDFVWYMVSAGTSRAHKAISCTICNKSLGDVLDEIIFEVKKDHGVKK